MSCDRRQFLQWLSAAGAAVLAAGVGAEEERAPHRRAIPSSDEIIPAIGMGTWLTFGIDPDNPAALRQRQQVLAEFLALGGGLLDSSPMYGQAEAVIGRCLQRIGHHRGLFAATKVWTHGNRQGLLQMEQSRLLWKLPRFDLMQVHNLMDWQTHLPQLREMKQRGDIRYLGVTTSHGRRHQDLRRIMESESLDFVQFTYNLLDREAERYLLPLAAERGIAVIINRPFQGGRLFDYVGQHPLPGWAADIDCSNWAQFFLKFIISQPAVTCAIPATSQLEHLQQNMGAAYGRLPDGLLRQRMISTIKSL
jgi:diketogulonate reductase-like aldo/keto reductase